MSWGAPPLESLEGEIHSAGFGVRVDHVERCRCSPTRVHFRLVAISSLNQACKMAHLAILPVALLPLPSQRRSDKAIHAASHRMVTWADEDLTVARLLPLHDGHRDLVLGEALQRCFLRAVWAIRSRFI